jgi:hypothetical protein
MMVYDRKVAASVHDETYRLVLCPDGCVYCGLKSKGFDHVPPLRFVHAAGPERFLYPACTVCNFTLGPLPDVCLRKRAAYLIRSYRAEWVAKKKAGAERWLIRAIETRGAQVRDRLADGATAKLCQCSRCCAETK